MGEKRWRMNSKNDVEDEQYQLEKPNKQKSRERPKFNAKTQQAALMCNQVVSLSSAINKTNQIHHS